MELFVYSLDISFSQVLVAVLMPYFSVFCSEDGGTSRFTT
jgi:hypothetical protein